MSHPMFSAILREVVAVPRLAKSSSNDSDRLSKYLARFGLSFSALRP